MTELPPGALPAGSIPGPPPTLWSPSLTPGGAVFQPPLAVWHPHWQVWVALALGEVVGETPPADAILLTPAIQPGG